MKYNYLLLGVTLTPFLPFQLEFPYLAATLHKQTHYYLVCCEEFKNTPKYCLKLKHTCNVFTDKSRSLIISELNP